MRRPKQRVLDFGRQSLDRHRGGRPRGPRPIVLHRRRKAFLAEHPCHVTLKVRAGLPSLRLPAVVREIEATFRRASSRKDFRLVHYSIQDDHAHLIVEANGTAALGRGMKSLASRFAFAVNRARAHREGARRALSPAHHEVPAAGAEHAGLRAARRPEAHGEADRAAKAERREGGVAHANGSRARCRFFGSLVRGLASRHRRRSLASAPARRNAGRGRAAHVVPARGMASLRPIGSERDPGRARGLAPREERSRRPPGCSLTYAAAPREEHGATNPHPHKPFRFFPDPVRLRPRGTRGGWTSALGVPGHAASVITSRSRVSSAEIAPLPFRRSSASWIARRQARRCGRA
jgi:REP element-mobilizing transposase RayT